MRSPASFLAFCLAALVAAGPAEATASPASDLVARKAAVLEMLHRKARTALVTVAQDKSFRDYFTTTSPSARSRLKDRIDRISLEVQRQFHVNEMCVIRPDGSEVSRIAHDAIADDLDDAERDRPFFRPGFALNLRTVYQSPPYLSPDTRGWVIGYVTPIVVGTATKAILHYEHDLGFYQTMLGKGLAGEDRFLVAVDEGGWVIADSRTAINIGSRGGSGAESDYFRPFEWTGLSLEELRGRLGRADAGEIVLDGRIYDVALRQVAGWTLVAVVAR